MLRGPKALSNAELMVIILRTGIKNSSATIIMVHNHPSGDPSPSKDDIDIAKRIWKAGKILGNGIYVSLKEKNLF